ncbi:MAG: hypothetical protein U0798_20015 [Gemmataceae bacterium]
MFNVVRRFWFSPNDPTTLGFIRVVTGMLVLYTHLAYTYDLTGFFGKAAWWDLASIDRERREYPHIAPPLNGWDDTVASARVPETPHRKKAFVAWMKVMIADPKTRDRGMEMLKDLQSVQDGIFSRQVLLYVQQLQSDPKVRQTHLNAMVKEALRNPLDVSAIPQYLKSLPETGLPSRESYGRTIEQFYSVLPKDPDERMYVLNHLVELDDRSRSATVEFLISPETTDADIDYLAYWGFEGKKAIRKGQPIFSIWFHISEPSEMALAHVIVLVIMTLFTLGLWTRVTSVLTWLAAVSYIHRTQFVLFGMDTMSNILLIYLMIGDSGGAFSLDRVIARFRATRASIKRCGTIDAATAAFLERPPATMSAGLALRLLQVHFCFIYMAAGLSKLKGSTWWTHHAYWDTIANPEFTMIQYQWYESLLRSIARFRPAFAITAAAVIFHTFIAEIGLPFLAWTRARPWIVILGFLLHAGIAIFMGLTVFSLLMMILLLSYLPGAAIRGRLMGKADKKLTVLFNPNDETQVTGAARAMAIDSDEGIELKPDTTATCVKVSQSGAVREGAGAAAMVASHSSMMNWVTWIPGVSSLLASRFGMKR